MSSGLKRYQENGDLHAINFCCFRNRSIFNSEEPRDAFLRILEETRQKYQFDVFAYVVMPTHVHVLVSEPKFGKLSTAIQVLKQRFSRNRIESEVWEARYYDFNIRTRDKLLEKIVYIHNNPVEAGLALHPSDWTWSSYRAYFLGGLGPVIITKAE